MDSVSIELWLDKRQLAALEQTLTEDGTTVERTMQEQLNELYAQRVPPEQQEKIQQELDAEQLESQRSVEANTRYAGFHITENGQEHYLSTKSGQEFLDMAILMRRYVRGTFGDKEKGFARCIYGAEEISPQRFEQLAAWRLENFGKVTGLVEIDFDKGLLSALNIMDGWQSFRLKDVSSAAYFADKSGHVNKEVRWNIFLSRLEGKQLTSHTQAPVELHGSRRLRPEEIIFSDEISELDGRLNFYMDCSFNPDEVFGTHVDSADNNNWLNIYAEYDLENSQVCDALKVILCREDGFDYEMAYQLNAEKECDPGQDGPVLPRKIRAISAGVCGRDGIGDHSDGNAADVTGLITPCWPAVRPCGAVLPPSWHPYPSTGLKRRVRALCRCADRDSSQP